MIKLSILIPCWNQEELAIKALDSIPRRDDIEVLARDDGSDDKTYDNLKRYKKEHPDLNLRVFHNRKNMGLAYTSNKLLADSVGEYFHFMGNDDTVDTEVYSALIDRLGDDDVVCMNLRINNGVVWRVTEETKRYFCAQTARFIRKSIVDGIKFPETVIGASDWYFAEELLARNPKTVYTDVTAYNYNFPREGSLVDLRAKGVIPE